MRRSDREHRDRGGSPSNENDPERSVEEQQDASEPGADGDARMRQGQSPPAGQAVDEPGKQGNQHDGRQLHRERSDPDEQRAALGVGDQEDRQPPGELREPAESVGHQNTPQPRIPREGEHRRGPQLRHATPLPHLVVASPYFDAGGGTADRVGHR